MFLIGSPERSIVLIEKMFVFPKQEGLLRRGEGCTFHRFLRRRGLFLKRLWKVQGTLPFCDRHSDRHTELPILLLFQSPIKTAKNKE